VLNNEYGGNELAETYLLGPARPSLQDRIDIQDVISNLTFFIDNREFSRARELFTEDAVMDYSRVIAGSSPTRSAKDFLDEGDVVIAGFDATQHLITNFDIRVDGDTAASRSHFQANHWIGSRVWTVWGSYSQQLVRAKKGWRIKYHQCKPFFQGGDPSLVAEAAVRHVGAREV
jgi:SnoaL-like domain